MKKYTTYFLILHTALTMIVGVGLWFFLKHFYPNVLVDNYYLIPLFFYVMGIVFILGFRCTPIEQPKRVVNLYMLMRTIKVFISFVFVMVDWFLDKEHIRNFAIIFIIFYLINLIWETYIYLRMELYFKYKGDQLKSSKKKDKES